MPAMSVRLVSIGAWNGRREHERVDQRREFRVQRVFA